MVLPPAHNYHIGCAKRPLALDVCCYKISLKNISWKDSQTKEKISLALTPFSDETKAVQYNLCIQLPRGNLINYDIFAVALANISLPVHHYSANSFSDIKFIA
jgi:hypothetical protein